jgi:SAM-dependent methyltransferase
MRTADFTEEIVYQWQKKWSGQDIQQAIENCKKEVVCLPYFLKYLPKEGFILEAGCGLGQWVVYLGWLGYHMIGVEIVPDCVQMCKTHFPEINIHVADVRNLPFPNSYFSGYISIGVIEHMIEGPENTLKEMKRVLKPNGIAIITVPSYNYFLRFWYPIREIFIKIFRYNNIIRKILGKPLLLGNKQFLVKKLFEIKKHTRKNFWSVIGVDSQQGPMFIEYKYKKNQIDKILKSFNFEILESVPVYHPYVFSDTFGNIFFKKNSVEKNVVTQLNFVGKIVHWIFRQFGPHFFNYLYLYVVRNKG